MNTVQIVSLVFSILWLIAWAIGGVMAILVGHIAIGVGMLLLSPCWIVYDIYRLVKRNFSA